MRRARKLSASVACELAVAMLTRLKNSKSSVSSTNRKTNGFRFLECTMKMLDSDKHTKANPSDTVYTYTSRIATFSLVVYMSGGHLSAQLVPDKKK